MFDTDRNRNRMTNIELKIALFRETLRSFIRDRCGATAVIFAVGLVPVSAGLGMSVDMGRVYLARTNLQAALDAAALAGAIEYKATSDATKAMTTAQNVFAATAVSTGATLDGVNSKIDTANKAVDLVATTTINTPLIGLLSPSNQSYILKNKATASIKADGGLGKNLEVSMMLDTTISMDQNSGTSGLTKLKALQTAAKNLVDTVVQADQSKFTSRVALAPFASAVNVGPYFQTTNGASVPTTTSCSKRKCTTTPWPSVVERDGPSALTDDVPSTASFPSYYAMKGSALASSSYIANYERSATSNRPDSPILPLSSNTIAVKTAIDGLSSDGATAGHIGIGWSWYLLSPKWTSVWTGTAAPNVADNKTVKVAILMSDFDFNVYYQSSVGNMNFQAAELCKNMKAAGIVIYTVGFQVDTNNTDAMSLFEGCASSPSKAIRASNGNELIAVYDQIAKTVVASVSGPIRLSK